MSELTLRPLEPGEFDEWFAYAEAAFAENTARAQGLPLEAAREIARRAAGHLLPEGRATPGMRFLVGEDRSGARVGVLWIGPSTDGDGRAWVYDVLVDRPRRGEGWGRALMQEAERLAREDGYAELDLNVFGFNTVARGLYESLGYEPVSIQMRKAL